MLEMRSCCWHRRRSRLRSSSGGLSMARRIEDSDYDQPSGSDAERSLLFQLRALGLPEPTREWRFSPPRRWRFDFAFVAEKIAVEIEGGIYVRGRHVRGYGFENDMVKYNVAALLGWRILRFTPRMVESGWALDVIAAALRGELTGAYSGEQRAG